MCLLDSKAAPAPVAVQQQLRKEKLAQMLSNKIEARPDKEDLEDKNILKGTQSVACVRSLVD